MDDELIWKQDAIDVICTDCCGGNRDYDCRFYPDCDNLKSIKALPPVQPKRGKWIRDGSVYYCSECKKYAHIDYNKWDVFSPGVWILSDFCHSCGADMRGDENGTD